MALNKIVGPALSSLLPEILLIAYFRQIKWMLLAAFLVGWLRAWNNIIYDLLQYIHLYVYDFLSIFALFENYMFTRIFATSLALSAVFLLFLISLCLFCIEFLPTFRYLTSILLCLRVKVFLYPSLPSADTATKTLKAGEFLSIRITWPRQEWTMSMLTYISYSWTLHRLRYSTFP